MIDVDPLVEASFDRMLPLRPVAADWGDVLERAGVRRMRFAPPGASRRRHVLLALALLALVAVVGAAYALGHPIVRFSSAPRAQSRTVVNFFGRMTLFGPGPKVEPHQARRITHVRAGGRDYVLRVAPLHHRGFCYAWSNRYSNCDEPPNIPYVEGQYVAGVADYEPRGNQHVLTLIGGSILERRAARIVLTYKDGGSSEIPFVWVTAPIRAGFYLYGIPSAHQQLGHQPVRLALLDRSGHTLYSERILGVEPVFPVRRPLRTVHHLVAGYPPLNVPGAAEWRKRTQLFRRRTDTGIRVGLWIAPARGGDGTCYWSNIHAGCGKLVANTPSGVVKLHWNKKLGAYEAGTPSPSAPRPRYWLKVMRGHGYVALCCTLDPRARRAVLLFEDGDSVTLTPRRGYLIWPIPHRHYRPGHRLDEIDLYGARGSQIGAVVFQPNVRALYPCAKPKDYGFGFKMCP
jgi:hypothetical protein